MERKEGTTSVTIDKCTGVQLDRLAKASGVTKKDFLQSALDYFERYGINPVKHESPAQEMQKLIKRVDQVVAFIRKQEQDVLRPLCDKATSMHTKVGDALPGLLTEERFERFISSMNDYIAIKERDLERREEMLKKEHEEILDIFRRIGIDV
jgi:hypothetical protein